MNRPLDALREWVVQAAEERRIAALRRISKGTAIPHKLTPEGLNFGTEGFDREYGDTPFSQGVVEERSDSEPEQEGAD